MIFIEYNIYIKLFELELTKHFNHKIDHFN